MYIVVFIHTFALFIPLILLEEYNLFIKDFLWFIIEYKLSYSFLYFFLSGLNNFVWLFICSGYTNNRAKYPESPTVRTQSHDKSSPYHCYGESIKCLLDCNLICIFKWSGFTICTKSCYKSNFEFLVLRTFMEKL